MKTTKIQGQIYIRDFVRIRIFLLAKELFKNTFIIFRKMDRSYFHMDIITNTEIDVYLQNCIEI